ncbi:MAG: TGS domain-containing protein, partial [Planctomycetes bacterium]|nr:TGS domain-containing protein [Planctomycetota bacterium]
MVTVRLPDGKELQHPAGVTSADIVRAIGPGLARAALVAKVDGEIVDLNRPLSDGSHDFSVLTGKSDDADALYVMRHSCAHVMAEAICSLWPQTKLVYGPPVDNGFYYDIDLDHSLTPTDFKAIEAKMAEIVKDDRPFTRIEMNREEAMSRLREEGNVYKIDNAERADGDLLSFYFNGEADSGCFNDLCRGPHVPSTKRVGAFKIMRVAGAYWHGDASKQVLQRVYGTCWPDKKSLKSYLNQLEEAKKRDHRKLGAELGLFVIDPLVGPGLILWKPRGAIIRHTLETMIREELMQRGYQPVYTPQIGRLELYRTSGHFPYYKESQYPPMYESDRARQLNALWEIARGSKSERADAAEVELFNRLAAEHDDLKRAGYPFDSPMDDRLKRIRSWLEQEDGYLLRPMNCPHHIRIFGSERRSYKELPIRLAEFGTVYRYEQSGEISGLLRVRGMTQDDAHIFCTPEQLQDE